MKPCLEKCKITKIQKLNETVFDITVLTKNMAKNALPGQFVHIKCGEENFLRRPISICDTKDDFLRFVFEVKGKGTFYLSQCQTGDELDILGPLGNGFDLSKSKNGAAVFVGGGIGIFPLLKCEKLMPENSVTILGFRNKDAVIMENEFKEFCKDFYITTDDGSYGKKGFVTDVLKEVIKKEKVGCIYACGPMAMLKNVAELARENKIKCEVSLEERMGCGIGSCLVCACRIKSGDGEKYLHVCKDGPVFDGEKVIFND